MRMKWTGLLVAALAVGAAGRLTAQGQGWAVTPFVGYSLPLTNYVEPNNPSCCLTVEKGGGVLVGLTGELSLSKQFAVSGFVSSTVGLSQHATWDYSLLGAGEFVLGAATNQLGATFVIRPLGRLPNGAPKVFFVEAGAALTQFRFSEVEDRSGGGTASPSWNANTTHAVFGGGLTFRIGPRSTLVLFGRYNMALSEYESDGLTDWNLIPPPDVGQKVNILTMGVGLRTGR